MKISGVLPKKEPHSEDIFIPMLSLLLSCGVYGGLQLGAVVVSEVTLGQYGLCLAGELVLHLIISMYTMDNLKILRSRKWQN